jgi:hypothetical protein
MMPPAERLLRMILMIPMPAEEVINAKEAAMTAAIVINNDRIYWSRALLVAPKVCPLSCQPTVMIQ